MVIGRQMALFAIGYYDLGLYYYFLSTVHSGMGTTKSVAPGHQNMISVKSTEWFTHLLISGYHQSVVPLYTKKWWIPISTIKRSRYIGRALYSSTLIIFPTC